MNGSPVGLLIGSHIHPTQIAPLASLAEVNGFGELWLAEDLWFTSGVVCAGAALAATKQIPVGVGIQSAVTRHTSIQALDFATLCQIYPGRFWPGIGLGLPVWLDQMGVRPTAPLRAVRETVECVTKLLAGEAVTIDGTQKLDAISLAHPPADPPPVYIGAVGPKSIQQAGRIADGLVVSVTAGTEYVRWSRKLLDEASQAAVRTATPRMVTFAIFSVDDDTAIARAAVRDTFAFYLTAMQGTDLMSVYGIDDDLARLVEGGPEYLVANMPEQWIADLTISGNPQQCAMQIDALLAAGSDSVILFPAPFDRSSEMVEAAGSKVLPLVDTAHVEVAP